ncbi:unnamed protein product [Closterium sp. NIES-54]
MPGSGGKHRCRDQRPHRADAVCTTHGAAEGWGRRENSAAAGAAGADCPQRRFSAKLHSDYLHHRHLLHPRYHRHRRRCYSHNRLECA